MDYSKYPAQQTMNNLGREQKPFLFVIDYAMQAPIVLPVDQINAADILFEVKGKRNYHYQEEQKAPISLEKMPVSFKTYRQAFDRVISHIRRGDSFLVNLTFPTPIRANTSLKEIFFRSAAPYKLWIQNKFVCFSPEAFIRIQNGTIASYPMKGTIDAAVPNAQENLLSDTKELAEHVTIVDLIRNDLSMYAEQVKVNRFRYVEEIKTTEKILLQVSSEITGTLPENYRELIGDIVFSMLPAGSICGAPKPKTLAIIKECEIYQRGYYTGVFGYFDGTNLESAVMIRFIEQENGELIYKSGGGITAHSKAASEYQELIDKVYVPVN